MTAAGIDSTMLTYMLEDTDVVLSETQEEEPGLTLAAQLMPMATMLRFKIDEDNTSTSVVSEYGPDHDQDQDQEDIPAEKLDSELLDRVLTTQELGHQLIHSNLAIIELTSEVRH